MRGLSWQPCGLLPPGERPHSRPCGHPGPARPPSRAASHHHGMLLPPLAGAMAARATGAPRPASRWDRSAPRPWPVSAVAPAGRSPCRWSVEAPPEVLSRILLMHEFRYALPLQLGLDERGSARMISFKGAHFPQDIILMGVRWYLAYPLSYRHVEALLEARGVPVDHATIQRWVVKDSPQREEALHRRKRPVWVSWRMDETYIRVKG